jgi:hypothetical protein
MNIKVHMLTGLQHTPEKIKYKCVECESIVFAKSYRWIIVHNKLCEKCYDRKDRLALLRKFRRMRYVKNVKLLKSKGAEQNAG